MTKEKAIKAMTLAKLGIALINVFTNCFILLIALMLLSGLNTLKCPQAFEVSTSR